MTRKFWACCVPIGLLSAVCALALGSGVAQAASCPAGSVVWTGGSGYWSADAADWSDGVVPGNQYNNEPNICIPSGTVVLDYQTEVNSITVLGGATLDVWGQANYTHGLLTLANQDAGLGIAAGGVADLGYYGSPTDQGYETHGGFDALSGTLVNDGSITSEVTGDETPNLLYGSFDNAGTLTVDNTLDGQPGTWTLGGTVNNTSGQLIALTPAATGSVNFTGAVSNSGTFTIGDGINVTATSGTASGNAIILGNGIFSPSGTGSATFHIEGGSAQLGSSIASGYTVWSSGIPGYTHGDLTATGSYTNSGTLELGSSDGTHGTLTIPSGDTFTNAGTLIFENTANGPDGLNGTFVNQGKVSVQNQFQGSGAITNNGSIELTAASGQNSAASFAQGSGGTLILDVTGGGSPVVPGLQLTGTASLGGTLEVNTTTGTATGTFPIVTATALAGSFGTSFSGEDYGLSTADGVLSLTGPASAASTSVVPGASDVRGGSGSFSLKLACASASTCLSATVTARIERIRKVHGRRKAITRVVSRKVETLASGQSKTVRISIARSFLAHGRIRVEVSVTSGATKLASATVTVTPAKRHRKRHRRKHRR